MAKISFRLPQDQQSGAGLEDFADKAVRRGVIVLTYVGPVALAFFVLSLISLYFK